MLNESDVKALVEARHADPFSVLGLHADATGKFWLRAFLPGAASVTILDRLTGKPLAALLLRHVDGLFEAQIPRRRKRFDYRLAVVWTVQSKGTAANIYADAYNFGPQLGNNDLQALHEGTHLRPYLVLGAHSQQHGNGAAAVTGIRFAVWAPNAKRVRDRKSVV